MIKYKIVELIESFGHRTNAKIDRKKRRLVSKIRSSWLKTKFVTGCWQGVMIHANTDGALTNNKNIQGLTISPDTSEFKAALNGKDIIAIAPKYEVPEESEGIVLFQNADE